MNPLFILILLFSFLKAGAQKALYSTAQAHSHNDYENAQPFWGAWKNQFGSIEADIYLHENKLVVAHDSTQLARRWTLDSLYLQPLEECIRTNNGNVYPEVGRPLQLMIDIKSEATATLNRLIEEVKSHPLLLSAPALRIVISGNRPDPATFSAYPEWIFFDGDLRKEYTPTQLERIVMWSGNFKHYSTWKGEGKIKKKERSVIRSLVEKAHAHHKKIRFWNAPDNLNAWKKFLRMKVDYVNTDKIEEMGSFMDHF